MSVTPNIHFERTYDSSWPPTNRCRRFAIAYPSLSSLRSGYRKRRGHLNSFVIALVPKFVTLEGRLGYECPRNAHRFSPDSSAFYRIDDVRQPGVCPDLPCQGDEHGADQGARSRENRCSSPRRHSRRAWPLSAVGERCIYHGTADNRPCQRACGKAWMEGADFSSHSLGHRSSQYRWPQVRVPRFLHRSPCDFENNIYGSWHRLGRAGLSLDLYCECPSWSQSQPHSQSSRRLLSRHVRRTYG